MSSAMNHKKRSRYSEQVKGGAFYAQSRRAFYNTSRDSGNRSILGLMAKAFHRRAPKQTTTTVKEG